MRPRRLRRQGFRSPAALSTWESRVITRDDAEVRVTSLPGQHAPRPVGYVIPPVMGNLLDFSRGGQRLLRLYITGDTLMHNGIRETSERFGDIDLCLIHLGGTRIAGILLTMDARQGIQALRTVAPRRAIPVHYDDYTLFKSPLSDFRRAAEAASLPTEVHYLARGDSYRHGPGAGP
jgi:L-ascorbate metabolism protein UlaG (beta-lactamase superfamily)